MYLYKGNIIDSVYRKNEDYHPKVVSGKYNYNNDS